MVDNGASVLEYHNGASVLEYHNGAIINIFIQIIFFKNFVYFLIKKKKKNFVYFCKKKVLIWEKC